MFVIVKVKPYIHFKIHSIGFEKWCWSFEIGVKTCIYQNTLMPLLCMLYHYCHYIISLTAEITVIIPQSHFYATISHPSFPLFPCGKTLNLSPVIPSLHWQNFDCHNIQRLCLRFHLHFVISPIPIPKNPHYHYFPISLANWPYP